MIKAILVSFFLHAAAIALALYLHAKPGSLEVKEAAEEENGDLVVQAPLGHVFVQEAPLDSSDTSADGKLVEKNERPADSPMTLPGEVKDAKQEPGADAASGPAGVPDGEAQPIGNIEPSYPPVSRRLGEEGEAVFLLSINANGTVAAADLEKTSGHERLDTAARAALLAALFAVPEGAPAPARKRFRVEFRLEK